MILCLTNWHHPAAGQARDEQIVLFFVHRAPIGSIAAEQELREDNFDDHEHMAGKRSYEKSKFINPGVRRSFRVIFSALRSKNKKRLHRNKALNYLSD